MLHPFPYDGGSQSSSCYDCRRPVPACSQFFSYFSRNLLFLRHRSCTFPFISHFPHTYRPVMVETHHRKSAKYLSLTPYTFSRIHKAVFSYSIPPSSIPAEPASYAIQAGTATLLLPRPESPVNPLLLVIFQFSVFSFSCLPAMFPQG